MIHETNTDDSIDFPRDTTRMAFIVWLNSPAGNTDLDMLQILDGRPNGDAWIAFQAGRQSMYKDVMYECRNAANLERLYEKLKKLGK